MYNENLAAITADHLRTHISGYIEDINAEFGSSGNTLLAPPSDIRINSSVGGVFAFDLVDVPVYVIDSLRKSRIPLSENLVGYQYDGHIAGLVKGSSVAEADEAVKRHARLCEYFVRNHELLHQPEHPGFTLLAFGFLGADFSGAEVTTEDETELWIAGFRLDVFWQTSEDDSRQHG